MKNYRRQDGSHVSVDELSDDEIDEMIFQIRQCEDIFTDNNTNIFFIMPRVFVYLEYELREEKVKRMSDEDDSFEVENSKSPNQDLTNMSDERLGIELDNIEMAIQNMNNYEIEVPLFMQTRLTCTQAEISSRR